MVVIYQIQIEKSNLIDSIKKFLLVRANLFDTINQVKPKKDKV